MSATATTQRETPSLEDIRARAASLTEPETRRLAGAWRRQIGGFYGQINARRVAAANHRDEALKEFVAAARTVGELDGKSTEREQWDAACARMAVADAMLASSVHDLVGEDGLRPHHVAALLGPWRHVVGT